MNRYQRRRLRETQRASEVAGIATVFEDLPEKAEQLEVTRLYRELGLKVVSFSQPRATKQTCGIPDLKIYCERKGLTWWFEVKRQTGGKQSDTQKAYQKMAERCGETYLMGGFEEAYDHLKEIGVIVKGAA